MILLIAGSSHTGKTLLAQHLLQKYHYPYLSIDHLKMGLIRSGYCPLTPESDDEELTAYLWPVVREIIKTNIENHQNLIIEGCYIPFDYQKDFEAAYLEQIRYVCLIFSEQYIHREFAAILEHASAIEQRIDDSYCTMEMLLRTNQQNLALCKEHQQSYILIDDSYTINFTL